MVSKLQNLLVSSMGLLVLGLPVSEALSANLPQWRPTMVSVAQVPKSMAAQYPRFRPVAPQPQFVPQVAVAAPAPQAYYAQPIAPPVYAAPHYGWHMPQQVYRVPQAIQPQPVKPMVTVVAPEIAMRAPDANKWRPVMPNVVAVPQPQMAQPYIAQPNIAQQWRPAMAAVPPTPAYAYARPPAPTWPQYNAYALPAPAPMPVVPPVQAPVMVQPWWWQGQQWQTYPYAKPWPGHTSDIIADFPANMCAGCKT